MLLKAFYAGSFDPLTNGHKYVIDQCKSLFDTVIVGIGTNSAKVPMFSPEERRDIVLNIYNDINSDNFDCILFNNRLLINVSTELGCTHIVRGIRNAQDLDMEMTNYNISRDIRRDKSKLPSTIFIPTPPELSLVSSSMVKSLIGFDDWEENIKQYLPKASYEKVIQKEQEKRKNK